MLIGLALICAGLMGYAVQRGATCMVVAMDEVVRERRATRFVALIEAAAIVATGIVLARLSGLLDMLPKVYAVSGWTIAGGVVMGMGAFIAGSCVFGAIAKLGSGNWSYALVPVGFFAGTLVARMLGMETAPVRLANHSPLVGGAELVAAPLLALAAWRLWQSGRALLGGQFRAYVWSPHVATGVIGLTFVVLLFAVGPWAYTELLAELARRMAHDVPLRLALFAALLGGAILGGWTAGWLGAVRPTAGAMARCLAGGALMGLGGALVPGTNDSLLLLGVPLIAPYALVALASMAGTIALALAVQPHARRIAARPEMA